MMTSIPGTLLKSRLYMHKYIILIGLRRKTDLEGLEEDLILVLVHLKNISKKEMLVSAYLMKMYIHTYIYIYIYILDSKCTYSTMQPEHEQSVWSNEK